MFITSNSRIEQTNTYGYWKLIDNEVYVTESQKIILAPRGLWSDGYTFPLLIMPFIGDKNKFDVRPAHQHDLMCRFHEYISIDLTVSQLISKGYLREHKDKIICEDIPTKYLTINKICKKDCDDLLKEMMLYCNIPFNTCNIVRFGVTFNLNWYLKTGKKSISEYDLFNEDIGLVNGL